ncbi:MAG: tetratricopeptide repeat protein [Myxococcales bacterium]|jgi:hypothetical protein
MMNAPHLSPLANALLGVLVVLQIWMLVDSIRRRAPAYWPFLILIFTPAAIAYFFMIKLPELTGRKPAAPAGFVSAGPSLEEVAELARQTPSELNKLAFADRLAELGRFPEAVGRYRDVLRQNKDSKEALHGLARALLNLGRPQEAIEELAALMELDPEFRDYSAALDYAEALWQAKQQDDAIGLLTGLVSVSKRINHRMALAHYLKERGDAVTARSELDAALSEFASSPDFVKKRDQRWADRARKLRAELN